MLPSHGSTGKKRMVAGGTNLGAQRCGIYFLPPLLSSFSFSSSSSPFLGFFQMEEVKCSGPRDYYQVILGTEVFLKALGGSWHIPRDIFVKLVD